MPSPRATTPFDKRERPVLHQISGRRSATSGLWNAIFSFRHLPLVPLLDTFFIISFLSPHFLFLSPFFFSPPAFPVPIVDSSNFVSYHLDGILNLGIVESIGGGGIPGLSLKCSNCFCLIGLVFELKRMLLSLLIYSSES